VPGRDEIELRRYRCLNYAFEVVADRAQDLAAVESAYAPFASDAPPACRYRIADLDDAEDPLRFGLEIDGESVRRAPDVSTVLDYLFWHVNDRLARLEETHTLLHAGVVTAADGRALLLPAASGSGKSTTTLGLVRAGFGYLSDEFAVLDPNTHEVHPFPRPLALKPGTRKLFPELDALAVTQPPDHGTAYVPPVALRPDAIGRTAPIGWVVFVRYEAGAATSLEPLTKAQTLVALAENTFHFPERSRAALPLLADVASASPGFRLRTGDLAEAVARLAELTAS
jgi:hypothetical protein